MTDKADSCTWSEFHVFEEVIELDCQSLPQVLYRFLCASLIRRTDEHATAILYLQAGLEKDEVLAGSLVAVHEYDYVLSALVYSHVPAHSHPTDTLGNHFFGVTVELKH